MSDHLFAFVEDPEARTLWGSRRRGPPYITQYPRFISWVREAGSRRGRSEEAPRTHTHVADTCPRTGSALRFPGGRRHLLGRGRVALSHTLKHIGEGEHEEGNNNRLIKNKFAHMLLHSIHPSDEGFVLGGEGLSPRRLAQTKPNRSTQSDEYKGHTPISSKLARKNARAAPDGPPMRHT